MTASLLAVLHLLLPLAQGAPKKMSALPVQGYAVTDRRLPHALWLETRPPWLDGMGRGWILPIEPWRAETAQKPVTIRLGTAKAADVFDALTRADTSYIWSDEGGVVNFVPLEATWGLIVRDVLDMPIGEFRLEGAMLEQGLELLVKQGRSAGAQSLATRTDAGRGAAAPNPGARLLSLRVQKATLRSGLNALVRTAAPAEWIAYATDEGLVLRAYTLPRGAHDAAGARGEAFPDLRASIRELEGRRDRMQLAPFEQKELDWQRDLLDRLLASVKEGSP